MSKSSAQFDQELSAARAKLTAARAELSGVPGIVTVNVGIKATGGRATEQVAFLVYVAHKKPVADLAPEERVPKVVQGLPTDVVASAGIAPEDVLYGGGRITQAQCGASSGTLGIVGRATAPIRNTDTEVPAGAPIALTNWHVAEGVGSPIGTGCFCDCCCCACGRFGELVDAVISQDVDGSVASIDGGQRFTNEILAIGSVRGAGVAQVSRVVLKYGNRTKLTRGRIMDVNAPTTRTDDRSFVNQIRVSPIGSDRMSNGGDSGSVYVDELTRQVVGLHHAGNGDGFANRIQPVMAALSIDFDSVGTPGAIPLASLDVPAGPTPLEAVAALRSALEQTPAGQSWIELVRHHAPEVRDLVRHDRAAMLAWQQCQGPAFVANYLRAARDARHRLPREIGGMRAENVIVSMASVLQRVGSSELRDAITEHYLTALQVVPGCDSLAELSRRAEHLCGEHGGRSGGAGGAFHAR